MEEKISALKDEAAKRAEQVETAYDTMSENAKTYYDKAAQGVLDAASAQTDIQQAQTDFAISQIEQQKVKAEEDYKKEQSAAYVDYKKQSNPYGANAEQMAAAGLTNTGYAESSNVAFYTAYQNRVAVARESFNSIITAYDNDITAAKLQNSEILAEIALAAQQEQLSIVLSAFEFENELLLQKQQQLSGIDDEYFQRYLDLYDREEEARRFDEQMAAAYADSASGADDNTLLLKDGEEEESGFWNYLKTLLTVGANGTEKYEVETDYYKGDLNPDASAYGTFANGYQPKGISGHGELSKTGRTMNFTTQTLDGKTKQVTQNVWKAEDGTLWYWEGRENQYLQISPEIAQENTIERNNRSAYKYR